MKKALLVMFFMVLPVAVPSQHVPDHTNPGSLLQRVERVERWAMSSRVMLTECIDELSITDSQRKELHDILKGIAAYEQEIFSLIGEIDQLLEEKKY